MSDKEKIKEVAEILKRKCQHIINTSKGGTVDGDTMYKLMSLGVLVQLTETLEGLANDFDELG